SSPCGGLLRKSTMSLPEVKQSSVPPINTTRIDGVCSAADNAAVMALYISCVNAFLRSVRCRRISITPSASLTRTYSDISLSPIIHHHDVHQQKAARPCLHGVKTGSAGNRQNSLRSSPVHPQRNRQPPRRLRRSTGNGHSLTQAQR